MNLADLRENYTKGGIRIVQMDPDPLAQLQAWIETAHNANIPDANAMNLATANSEGIVSSRTVLLKGIVDQRLQFFTNYQSQKANDLSQNPNAALTFLWKELERQICIRGTVEKTSRKTSEEYFASRPYESQIGAWVSEKQSGRIGVRALLEKKGADTKKQFPENQSVPCPEFWGGYQLSPTHIEFWQGREGRLHDRLCYRLIQEKWVIERLSP